MDAVKEAAKGALILTFGCLGLVVLLLGALWLGGPIYEIAGRPGILLELVALLFLIPFLGALFAQRFFGP